VNGAAPGATGPLDAPPTLTEPGWFGTIVMRDWHANWSRSIQTMLDVAHIPFVHPKSIGTAFGRALGTAADARFAQDLVPDEHGGFRMDWRLVGRDGVEAGDGEWVAFHPPNGMSLGITQKQAGVRRSTAGASC